MQNAIQQSLPSATTVATQRTAHIVSSRFAEFADNVTVFTVDTAMANPQSILASCNCIMLGQGLSRDEAQQLTACLLLGSPEGAPAIIDWVSKKADKETVHKIKDSNVLITAPTRLSDHLFESHLVVDDDCAEMSDHQTGEHIQGAVLIEAARQMFMASTITYSMVPSLRGKTGPVKFILSEMQVLFHGFIFPVHTRITLEFGEIRTEGGRASGSCQVGFYQFDNRCCEVRCTANAYPEKTLVVLETRSANTVRRNLANSM